MTVKTQKAEKRVGEVLDLVRTGQMTPVKGKKALEKVAAKNRDMLPQLQSVIDGWEVVQDYLKRAVVSKLTEHAFESESEKTSIAALRELTKVLGARDNKHRQGVGQPTIYIHAEAIQIIDAVERQGEN